MKKEKIRYSDFVLYFWLTGYFARSQKEIDDYFLKQKYKKSSIL